MSESSRQSTVRRAAACCAGLAVAALLAVAVAVDFVTASLADPAAGVSEATVRTAAELFPWSARLQRRAAALALRGDAPDFAAAVAYARRATELSSSDAASRVILASAEELSGDASAAERDLRAACALAPGQPDPRWRLGNLLVRRGRVDDGLAIVASAVAQDSGMLAPALDLAWQASSGRGDAVLAVAGDGVRPRVEAARFLLAHGAAADAVGAWRALDADARRASASDRFLTELALAGHPGLARQLFAEATGPDTVVYDGGFDAPAFGEWTPFAWTVHADDFARVALSPGSGTDGSVAARVDFAGRDTTTLRGALEQPVALRPGIRYRAECRVKTSGLATPEGPRLVVRTAGSLAFRAASAPIVDTDGAWTTLSFELVAPAGDSDGLCPLVVALERAPSSTYDLPTRGSLWIDDVRISEVAQ